MDFDKKFPLQLAPQLSAEGLDEICPLVSKFMDRDFILDEIGLDFNLPGLGGKWPKRLKKRLLEIYPYEKSEINALAWAKIGQIAERHSRPVNVQAEFTRNFDWRPGDFGEERDSCWWTLDRQSRPILAALGGFAFRFYFNDVPTARAWVLPVPAGHLVFNGYWKKRNDENVTALMARALAAHWHLSYTPTTVYQKNRVMIPSQEMHINDTEHLVGRREALNRTHQVRLEYELFVCLACKSYVSTLVFKNCPKCGTLFPP